MASKKIVPIIKSLIDYDLETTLADPFLSEDIMVDHNKILKKLIAASIYNLFNLIVSISFLTYMLALLW